MSASPRWFREMKFVRQQEGWHPHYTARWPQQWAWPMVYTITLHFWWSSKTALLCEAPSTTSVQVIVLAWGNTLSGSTSGCWWSPLLSCVLWFSGLSMHGKGGIASTPNKYWPMEAIRRTFFLRGTARFDFGGGDMCIERRTAYCAVWLAHYIHNLQWYLIFSIFDPRFEYIGMCVWLLLC